MHGVHSGLVRRFHAAVELRLHGLDDHYGVIDHRSYGKNQCEEGKDIDAESQNIHECECTYNRDYHGQRRDQG